VFFRRSDTEGSVSFRRYLWARNAAGCTGTCGAGGPGHRSMIIRIIASSRSVEIDDARNFRAFSVRIEGPMTSALQAELLGGIAVSSDGEHAWVSEKTLREWPTLKS